MNKTKLYESPDVTIFLWKGGPEVGVVKADIYKSVELRNARKSTSPRIR